jgi:RNA-directed DNA polymerase
MGSYASKLISVRRVTQDNKGKNTAGLDGVKSVPPGQRLELAKSLDIPVLGSPLRRVWIPKPGKTEMRPLGIPTIKDRCLQALFKLALEPEWEAKFEENSYGFRPGRSCHDAISAIRSFVQKRPKYVLDADIAKCFDRMNHKYLLDKIGMKGKYRKQLESWLNSGVLDTEVFSDTTEGTPQGGVISPLLANIALHGMEEFCKNEIKDIPVLGSTGKLVKPSRRGETLGFVRYADDFVIMHPDLRVITLLKERLPIFLAKMGLELSPTKTRITHTLEIEESTSEVCPGLNNGPGFNFLGFFIRQYKTRHLSALGPSGLLLGFRTLIIPSKEKRNAHLEKLHKIVLQDGKGMSQDLLIKKLNPVIRGWANYFGKSDANTLGLLGQMNYALYLQLRHWAKRVYATSGKGKSTFRRIGTNKWTFATAKSILVSHIDYSLPLSEYVKVRGDSSPYDENQIYWAKRLSTNNFFNIRVTTLLKKQKGICHWCKSQFNVDEIMEVDHIIPRAKGGKDEYKNLQLLHRHCHDRKTSQDLLPPPPALPITPVMESESRVPPSLPPPPRRKVGGGRIKKGEKEGTRL